MSTTAASPPSTDAPAFPTFTSKRRKIFRRRERSSSPPSSAAASTDAATAPSTSGGAPPPSPPAVKPSAIRRPVRRFGLEVTSQSSGPSQSTGGDGAAAAAGGTVATSAESDAQAVINRFTHQTGQILDVDKHMMAYIESRMKSSSVTPVPTQPPPPQQQQQQPQQPTQPTSPQPSAQRTAFPASSSSESRGATLGKLHEVDLGEDARRRNILLTTAALSTNTPPANASTAPAAPSIAPPPAADRTPHPLTLIAPTPPANPISDPPHHHRRTKKLKRTAADIERDRLVEEILQEYTSNPSHPVPDATDSWDLGGDGDGDMAADDRIAEKFRKEFVDAMLSKRRRRGGEGGGAEGKKGEKDEKKRPKGPKLGGSRMARQQMREREMGKK